MSTSPSFPVHFCMDLHAYFTPFMPVVTASAASRFRGFHSEFHPPPVADLHPVVYSDRKKNIAPSPGEGSTPQAESQPRTTRPAQSPPPSLCPKQKCQFALLLLAMRTFHPDISPTLHANDKKFSHLRSTDNKTVVKIYVSYSILFETGAKYFGLLRGWNFGLKSAFLIVHFHF